MRFDFLRCPQTGSRDAGFLESNHGTAAVELALILPSALIMLSLAVMAGQGFEIERRATLAARTVTDLVSKAPYVANPSVAGATELNQSALDTDLALSSEIMWPNSTASLQVVVSELLVNSTNNTGKVVWSEPYNGATALAAGTVVSLQPTMVAAGASYLIYGQVRYTFQPLNIYTSVGSITFNEGDMLVPRNAAQITINYGQ